MDQRREEEARDRRMPNQHFNRWRAEQRREAVACRRRRQAKEQSKEELAKREDEFAKILGDVFDADEEESPDTLHGSGTNSQISNEQKKLVNLHFKNLPRSST